MRTPNRGWGGNSDILDELTEAEYRKVHELAIGGRRFCNKKGTLAEYTEMLRKEGYRSRVVQSTLVFIERIGDVNRRRGSYRR